MTSSRAARAALALSLALALAACGSEGGSSGRGGSSGAQSGAQSGPRSGGGEGSGGGNGGGSQEPGGEARAPANPRLLEADATFGDLVEAVRGIDQRREGRSDAGCLLARRGGRHALAADLAVAVRPLPELEADLDGALAAPAPINLLSRWGRYGSGEAGQRAFSAMTTTLPPLREPALLVVLTDRGLYLRRSDAEAVPAGPLGREALIAAVGDGSRHGALFVTAEPGRSLRELEALLAALGEVPGLEGRIGLAAALAEGTRLPAQHSIGGGGGANEPAGAALCPGGLPLPPEDAAEGQLETRALLAALGPLQQAASGCVGGLGGRIVVAMRIGPDGLVQEACVREDEVGDPSARACLTRSVRELAFPQPSPAGFVDVELPLRLALTESERQRPLCP